MTSINPIPFQMISTPIGITLQTQPPVLYQSAPDPAQSTVKPDPGRDEPEPPAVESSPQNHRDTNLVATQQSELYAEYLSNPYNEAKEATLDPEGGRLLSGTEDRGGPEPPQKSLSADATPMHAKSRAQFGSSGNVRQDSGIFNLSSYFGAGNDLVIPGSEVFDTLMSTQEG